MQYLNTIGEFECTVTEPKDGWFTEINSQPVLNVPLVVSTGDNEGQTITHKFWLGDESFPKSVKKLIEVFSFDGDFDGLADGTKTLVGRRCKITTQEKVGKNGKAYIQVKYINNINGQRASGMKAVIPANLSLMTAKAQSIVSEMDPFAGA